MASARRQPALHIFQDPVASHDHAEMSMYNPSMLDAFGVGTDVSADHHTVFEPPPVFAQTHSPRKGRHPSSSPPPRVLGEKGLNAVSLPPPQEQFFKTDAPLKRPNRPIPKQSQAMAGQRAPLFTNFVSQFDKENVQHVPYSSAIGLDGPLVKAEPVKAGTKRGLSDAAPMRDRSKKQKVQKAQPVPQQDEGPLPEPEDMPPVEDDEGINKPPYSYAHLIGMAILRAPNRRLTLAQIYKWISDTFAFYRNSSETGWQNSIRHNLSLSKSFSKQERPKDDPGKGHYWRINEGFEKQYYKIQIARRSTNPDGFVPSDLSNMARPSSAGGSSFPHPQSVVKSIDSSKFPDEEEPSSDATILNSDPAAHDGVVADLSMPPPKQIPSSPPAQIHSSPPPVERSAREERAARDGTPPRVPRFSTHSRSGGRKRKFGDSGYYSSIESSAIKGNPLGPMLFTSEADPMRSSLKRGRAEEEIVRIRGSSYDSPSKNRTFMKQSYNGQPISSPFRNENSIDNNPLTPAFVFKRPALPPPSASPNTNLRNHRQRMRELIGGSPDKSMPVLVDSSFLDQQNWSPAVTIPNEEHVNLFGAGFSSTFDVFGDYDYQESPLKRSSKRPRLERAATTTGILADITGAKSNMASPTPHWKSPFLEIPGFSPVRQSSPLKAAPTSNPLLDFSLPNVAAGHTGLTPTQTFSAQQDPQDDDIFHLLNSDDSEPGIDLLQGFQKIGARPSVAPNGSPSKAKAAPRPSLTRSSTSRF